MEDEMLRDSDDATDTAPAAAPDDAVVEEAAPATPQAASGGPEAAVLIRSSLLGPTRIVALTFIVLAMGLIAWNTKNSAVRNTNVGSRYGTVEALVNHGVFYIDDTRYNRTIDKVMIDGHYYSSKPPLLPSMAAGVYAIYRGVTGYDIRTNEQKVVKFVNLVFGAGLHVVLLLHFYWLMLLFVRRQEAALVALAAVAFAYLGAGYAVELNNHSPAGAFALSSFYWAYRVRNGARLGVAVRPWHWVLSGIFAGLIPGISLPGGAISAGIFIYLALHDWRSALKYFVPGALPGVIAHFLLTYLATGSIVPVYLRDGAYDYPGSYWRSPRGMDALHEPKYIYSFHLLLGHHGLFSMTPAFIFSAVAIVKAIKDKSEHFAEAILIAAVVVVMTLFFIVRTNNYGGNCVGFRWAIPYMPLLFVFFADWLDRVRMRAWSWGLVLASLLVTQVHVHDAFWTPWHLSWWQRLFSVSGVN